MPLPAPEPGLVVRYADLWHAEHLQGREEGDNQPLLAVNRRRPRPLVAAARLGGQDGAVTQCGPDAGSVAEPDQVPGATSLWIDSHGNVSLVKRAMRPVPDPVVAEG